MNNSLILTAYYPLIMDVLKYIICFIVFVLVIKKYMKESEYNRHYHSEKLYDSAVFLNNPYHKYFMTTVFVKENDYKKLTDVRNQINTLRKG